MGWVRVSDDFYDHHKFSGVGPLESALWLSGLAWCNRNLSDGFIPRSHVQKLVDWEGVLDVLSEADPSNALSNAVTNGVRNSRVAATVATRLVKAGLWVEHDDGFMVHDYLVYQRSAYQIAEAAKANAARQKRFRDSHRGLDGNDDGNAVTNGHVTLPPNPNPNPKKAKSPSGGGAGDAHPQDAPSSKRGTRITEDWVPAESTRQRLLARYPGLSKEWWLEETDAFRDHWLSAGGRNAAKLDWNRAFNVWIKNAKKPQPTRSWNAQQAPPPGSGVWGRTVDLDNLGDKP